MGEYKAPNGTRSFEPDETDSEFYVATYGTTNLGAILERARDKWGQDIDIDDIELQAEHIHTQCLGHDCYDSGDYTNYIRVEYVKP